MGTATLLICAAAAFCPVSDPADDVYYPAAPGQPAYGVIPDLLSGAAILDAENQELRFEFTFDSDVYPADDYDHYESQLWGFVDIDLDVPAVDEGSSMKSLQSGYLSGLGIEAYVDLGLASGGLVELLDPIGGWIADVPLSFAGNSVTITVPFPDLYGTEAPGEVIAYAAYFYDPLFSTADVFPNGDGHVLAEPEPGSIGLVLLGAGCIEVWARRRRRSDR